MLSRQVPMFAVLSLALALTCGCAAAQSTPADDQRPGSKSGQVTRTEQGRVRKQERAHRRTEQETTPLADVMKQVSAATGTKFLLDYRVPKRIVTGPGDHSNMDYAAFLTVLDNNGLAAVETGDHVTVMPTGLVRQVRTPIVPVGATAPAGAWVTRVFFVEHLRAPQLVPILRPLMPSSGHLAAQADSNSLLVVDRFANTERLRQVIEQMDVPLEGR